MNKLAIEGGKPTRNKMLSYGKQSIDDNDINSVIEVLKSDYLTTGPYVDKFEKAIGRYVEAKYAVAVTNGTAALHVACLAAGIKEDDEVIVSSITFAASSNAVLYCGGIPVFADINPITYNIDIEDVKRKITRKTKAIIAVDFTGNPVDIDEVREICNNNNLIFIEDAAHSLGAEYKGKKIGSLADITTFSFHPVKPITTGEGGMITTNNKELYKKMLLFRSHGITREEELLEENTGQWYYEQLCLGYNYRMTDIQAALGISQLNKLNVFIKRRREIAEQYTLAFRNMQEIEIPKFEDNKYSGWHLYVIALNLDTLRVGRKEVFDALRAENIGVNVHYLPVYLHPYYKRLGYKEGLCKEAEMIYERIITLPLHPSMTKKDVEIVIEALRKVLIYFGK